MVAYNSKLASTKSLFIVLQNVSNVIHMVYFQTQGDRFEVVKGASSVTAFWEEML